MRIYLLVVTATLAGCQIVFPVAATPDAVDSADAPPPVTSRCPQARVRDDFEVAGTPGRFWDPAVSAVNEDGDLVLEASSGRILRSHRYYPISDGQSITLEIPPNDLTQEGSVLGLRLRYDTSPSRFEGDLEHSVEISISRANGELRLFKSAKQGGVQEDLANLAPYDVAAHRFLRITYDAPQARMVFATSADGENFIQLSQRDLPVADQGVRAVQFELFADRVSRARFASLCSDLAPARPAVELFEQFAGPALPAAWQIVERDCTSIAPNGADLILTYRPSGPSNCSVITRTAYDISSGLAVADLVLAQPGNVARTIVAVVREDGSRYQFVYNGAGMDQLRAEEVLPDGMVSGMSAVVVANPRFFHFHGLDGGLRLDYQVNVGPEDSTVLLTAPSAEASAVQLELAIVGPATSAAQMVILATSSTQPKQ